jgi:hypothetical protein
MGQLYPKHSRVLWFHVGHIVILLILLVGLAVFTADSNKVLNRFTQIHFLDLSRLHESWSLHMEKQRHMYYCKHHSFFASEAISDWHDEHNGISRTNMDRNPAATMS